MRKDVKYKISKKNHFLFLFNKFIKKYDWITPLRKFCAKGSNIKSIIWNYCDKILEILYFIIFI